MTLRNVTTAMTAATALVTPFLYAGSAAALTTSCSGVPSSSAITWSASASGGVAPFTFLWGNGSTSTSQVVSETAGTYTLTLQATDASSSVATTTCSATVAPAVQAVPTISSFVASPAAITAGQSSILSWSVSNASTTSLDNGIGVVTGTSVTVSPSATTTYTLTATNPGGSSTQGVTVSVAATSTSLSGITAQVQALLSQIAALKTQLAQLLGQAISSSGSSSSNTNTTATTTGCYGFGRNLGVGDRGDDVRELQKILAQSDPSLFASSSVSGYFGPQTQRALRTMQLRFGISTATSTTGYFGGLSRSFFRQQCGGDTDRHATTTWNGIGTSTPPSWNATMTRPSWNGTTTPPSWNGTSTAPVWNGTTTPPSWNGGTTTAPTWNASTTPWFMRWRDMMPGGGDQGGHFSR